jgi:hypothetical protein
MKLNQNLVNYLVTRAGSDRKGLEEAINNSKAQKLYTITTTPSLPPYHPEVPQGLKP